MFSRPFRKHGGVLLATYTQTYKKGDSVDLKAGHCSKGITNKYYQGKTGRVQSILSRLVGITVNKHVKGKILAKGTDAHTIYSSRNSFLKLVKENDQ